jgi:hypothetical protein
MKRLIAVLALLLIAATPEEALPGLEANGYYIEDGSDVPEQVVSDAVFDGRADGRPSSCWPRPPVVPRPSPDSTSICSTVKGTSSPLHRRPVCRMGPLASDDEPAIGSLDGGAMKRLSRSSSTP